jgi:hypothetical protein
MKRARDMASRLPLLYRDGELLQGVLEQPGQQIEILGEDALDVQRAHFFDDALEFDDAAKLAAILNFEPETWQTLELFRAFVRAQRDATLQGGAVTIRGIQGFVERFQRDFQAATGMRFPGPTATLDEFPRRRKFGRPPATNDITPLTRFTVENKGLDEAVVSFLLTGAEDAPESQPLIANLTTGEALLFHGNIGEGQRLWLRAAEQGTMTATLEARDVTEKLVSITNLTPGQPWDAPQIRKPAQAMKLARGENTLWFLPVAHFDEEGLDRFLLALAELGLAQGRWDEATLDHALFFQDAAVTLKASWVEHEPASFDVLVPAQVVDRRVAAAGTPAQARNQFGSALDEGVKRLKAAGVRGSVRLLQFSELQGSSEFLTAVLPLRLKEVGATGADHMPDKGGLFGVTSYGDSTFR